MSRRTGRPEHHTLVPPRGHRPPWGRRPQVLNILQGSGGTTWSEVFAVLRTFVDRAGLDAIVADLEARGWLERQPGDGEDGPFLRLTSAGLEAHRQVFERIGAVRRRAVDGISQDDYLLVVRTLQRMASNLA